MEDNNNQEQNQANNQEQSTVNKEQNTQAQSISPEDIANSLLSALENRQQRAENGVVKSFAQQYGMTEQEVNAILEAEKDKRSKQLPAEQQQAIDNAIKNAHDLLISAEVKAIGVDMGLVDADAALLLMNREGIKVGDKGGVTGVKEALEALQGAKPYLFSKNDGEAWGNRHKEEPGKKSGVEAAFERINPGLKISD